jgi:hypothetical protein
MQRNKPKWRADHGARALKAVSQIEASIIALDDEDLLDLHDIFLETPNSPLGGLAAVEVQRRGLKP